MPVFVQENYCACVYAEELLCLCLCRRTIVTVFVQKNYRECVCAGELS